MSNRQQAAARLQHPRFRPLAPALGLIGTLVLCAAAMIAHLSPVQLRPVATATWIAGFALQAAAFLLAMHARRAGR